MQNFLGSWSIDSQARSYQVWRKPPYSERLRMLNLPLLVCWQRVGDLMIIHSILLEMYYKDSSLPLKLSHNSSNQGNSFKLIQPCVCYNVIEYYSTYRLVSVQNNLSRDTLTALSILSIKSRLNEFCGAINFKFIWLKAGKRSGQLSNMIQFKVALRYGTEELAC